MERSAASQEGNMIRWILFVLLVLYIIVPILMPVIFSFSVFWQDILPQGFTLRWYETILTRPANYEALMVSFVVASSAVFLNLVITVPAAYALNRMASKWGQRLREAAAILPPCLSASGGRYCTSASFHSPPSGLNWDPLWRRALGRVTMKQCSRSWKMQNLWPAALRLKRSST